jgi:hypothetical protein
LSGKDRQSNQQEYIKMQIEKPVPKRFIGLDIHKHYLIAIGVDGGLNQVYGPQRVRTCTLVIGFSL